MKKFLFLAVAVLMTVSASAQDKGPRTGFRWGFNTGYVLGTKDKGFTDNWNFDFTCGAQIKPWFYVGGGIGIDVFTQSNKWRDDLPAATKDALEKEFPAITPIDIPVFANVKFFIPTRSIAQPYFDIRLGYAMEVSKHEKKSFIVGGDEVVTYENGWANSLIGEVSAGVELADHWNVSVGYHYRSFYKTESEGKTYTWRDLGDSNGCVLRIGYRF